MTHIRKRYIIFGIIALLVFLILFFLSSAVKIWLVKNSESLIGRKIEIGELHFNYARVAVKATDVVVYEKDQNTKFFTFHEFYINFDPWPLLANEYAFSEIKLDQARLAIIQNGEQFNFDDLLASEDTVETVKPEATDKELKFKIENIKLTNGYLNYRDQQLDNEMKLEDLNLDLPLIAWNNNQSDVGVNFSFGEKGKVEINATVDNKLKKYLVELNTSNVEVKPFTNYLKEYLDISQMNGLLTSRLLINGSMVEIMDISVKGNGYVRNFSMIDGQSKEIISAPEVSATISDIDLKKFHFGFSKIIATAPHLFASRDKDMTNIERFLLPYFRNDSIEMAKIAASGVVQEEEPLTYLFDTIRIKNGQISFTDHTLNRPFTYDLKQVDLEMTGLSESADQIPIAFSSILNTRGSIRGNAVFSMVDLMKLQLKTEIKKLDLLSFSPYSEYYVASPIKQGWGNYGLTLSMTPTYLKNDNKVRIEELEFGKRTKDTTAMKVPIRLALYIMKDANDVIAFELPVEGNPSEPKFKLGKIIWKVFTNLMVKTAVSPFKALAGLTGTNPESIEKLPFAFAQDSLDAKQKETLTQLANILKRKPDLNLVMTQFTDETKEKAQLAVLLAKEGFVPAKNTDNTSPARLQANQLPDNDPEFLAYLKTKVPDLDTVGLEAACTRLAGIPNIEARFQSLLQLRNRLVQKFLVENLGLDAASVQVSTTDLRNLPEELKKPEFKIEMVLK